MVSGPVHGHGPAQLGDLGRAGKVIQSGTSTVLMVRRTRRPLVFSTLAWPGTSAQGGAFNAARSFGRLALTVKM